MDSNPDPGDGSSSETGDDRADSPRASQTSSNQPPAETPAPLPSVPFPLTPQQESEVQTVAGAYKVLYQNARRHARTMRANPQDLSNVMSVEDMLVDFVERLTWMVQLGDAEDPRRMVRRSLVRLVALLVALGRCFQKTRTSLARFHATVREDQPPDMQWRLRVQDKLYFLEGTLKLMDVNMAEQGLLLATLVFQGYESELADGATGERGSSSYPALLLEKFYTQRRATFGHLAYYLFRLHADLDNLCTELCMSGVFIDTLVMLIPC